MTPDGPTLPDRTRVRQTQAQRTAESSHRILVAAIELFAARGYENTTTEQIAARAGYSRSMVNARFGSKEGLLESVLGVEWEGRLIEAATRPGADGRARVIGIVEMTRDLALEDPTFLRASMVVSFEAAGPMTDLRGHVTDRLRRIEAAIVAALALGVKDGSIHPDVHPASAGGQMVNAALGAMYRWIIDPESVELVAHLDAVRASLDRTLAP